MCLFLDIPLIWPATARSPKRACPSRSMRHSLGALSSRSSFTHTERESANRGRGGGWTSLENCSFSSTMIRQLVKTTIQITREWRKNHFKRISKSKTRKPRSRRHNSTKGCRIPPKKSSNFIGISIGAIAVLRTTLHYLGISWYLHLDTPRMVVYGLHLKAL